MHVSEQASGPDIAPYIPLKQPNRFTEKPKKNRVDIFVCKFGRYLNNNSAYRNTRASADD